MDNVIDSRKPYVNIILIAVFILGFFSGCGPVHKPFVLMDDKVQIKKGTLAVISGDTHEPTAAVAEYLTRELEQRSTFRVLGQKEIARRIAKYPVEIKQADPENKRRPVWFAKGEQSKLDAMQAKLKADYLFVIWTTGLVKYGHAKEHSIYVVGISGNLIEYPGARAVGYSQFDNKNEPPFCFISRMGKTEGVLVEDMLKDTAREMADKFLAATRAEKSNK